MSRLMNALNGFRSGWLGTITSTPDTCTNAGVSVLPEAFARRCCEPFGIHPAESTVMYTAMNAWNNFYKGSDSQLMKTICSEAAKLTLTDAEIIISSPRGTTPRLRWLQGRANQLLNQLQEKLELGYVLGSLVIKPCVDGLEVLTPFNYIPIEYDFDGRLTSAIFIKRRKSDRHIITLLEYHHFSDDSYFIDSKVFSSSEWSSLGYCIDFCPFSAWHYEDQVQIKGIDTPLFAQFKTPLTNNVDECSNAGISFCSSCFNLLIDFDKQYKEFIRDLLTARRTVFMANSAMQKITKPSQLKNNAPSVIENPAPDFIIGFEGNKDNFFEFNPTLNVDDRKAGLQAQLDMISSSIGFTSGYFSFDTIRGGVTATQIESEDQRTSATIASMRKPLEYAIVSAVKQLNVLCFIYEMFNESEYSPIDVQFTALDLSVTPAEDRERIRALVEKGLYPVKKYLAEYEGLTQDEIDEVLQNYTGASSQSSSPDSPAPGTIAAPDPLDASSEKSPD